MSNQVVEGFFLLAFWAPPLAVVICAGLLVVTPSRPRSDRADDAVREHATAA
jgi:hypothetical protein